MSLLKLVSGSVVCETNLTQMCYIKHQVVTIKKENAIELLLIYSCKKLIKLLD